MCLGSQFVHPDGPERVQPDDVMPVVRVCCRPAAVWRLRIGTEARTSAFHENAHGWIEDNKTIDDHETIPPVIVEPRTQEPGIPGTDGSSSMSGLQPVPPDRQPNAVDLGGLPACHEDQRDCCGCNASSAIKQAAWVPSILGRPRGHAGGLPTFERT
jgi:hypothetical protein